jgi:phage-related minor tail protein
MAEVNDSELPFLIDAIDARTSDLMKTANAFARAMTTAFAQSASGARSFENALGALYLRLSELSLRAALRPLESVVASGFNTLFGGVFGGGTPVVAASGAIKPFAAGGVIGTPTYFPLRDGGLGLVGEAGPEAILPLSRTADGKLGVAAQGGTPTGITINITTPDADSFRRSEVYVTGQIARAVARGQRGL